MNLNFNNNPKVSRHGFTLTEVLFVIAIIAVLGAMAAGILGKAKRDSEIAATRARITQIEAIMQTVIEDFEVRRLPVSNLPELIGAEGDTDEYLQVRNVIRRIRAALLQAEFPGPQVVGGEFVARPLVTGHFAPAGAQAPGTEPLGNFRTWMMNKYGEAVITALEGQVNTAEMTYWQTVGGDVDQPGEYLYKILERIDIDGISALEVLGTRVIGDTDDDAVPEIVDAFGNSMQLRIVQVGVTDTAVPGTDIWSDIPESEINWQLISADLDRNGTIDDDEDEQVKIPNGYQFLNPAVHRPFSKIRFQVVSPTLEALE